MTYIRERSERYWRERERSDDELDNLDGSGEFDGNWDYEVDAEVWDGENWEDELLEGQEFVWNGVESNCSVWNDAVGEMWVLKAGLGGYIIC